MTYPMTNLIDLNDHRPGGEAERDAGPRAGRSARILLFTGVRYERMEDDAVPARRERA